MNKQYPRLVVEFVDHSIITAPSRPETFKLATQRLSCSCRILREGAEYQLQRSAGYLLGEFSKVPQAFRSYLDFVELQPLDLVFEAKAHSLTRLGTRFAQRPGKFVVAEDSDGFLKGVKIVGIDQDK